MTVIEYRWDKPPARLNLAADEVHVWHAELDPWVGELPWLMSLLSPDERVRAERFCFPKDRQHFIVCRGLLRVLLSRYLTVAPQQLSFAYGRWGKPALAGHEPERRICFNLSHSQGAALYAVTRGRAVGVDLEQMRPLPDLEQLVHRFFSPRECAVIDALPPAQKPGAFFKGWTRKEAYLKATGEGLSGLDRVEVSLAPGEPAKLLRAGSSAKATERWALHEPTVAPGYAAALVVAATSDSRTPSPSSPAEGRSWSRSHAPH
jgi:4'-phosphopantetheinyl transferase